MSRVLKIFAGFALLLIVVAAGVGFYAATLFQPVNVQNQEKVRFVVPKGQSISRIGERLTEAGLIRHPYVFRFVVWRGQLANKIQAGSFFLSPSQSPNQVAESLTQGTNDIWVTILEGWRAEQIAEMLANQELDSFDKQEFLSLVEKNESEGYLFPDTYLIPRSADAEMIYNLLRSTFDKRVTQGLEEEITASGKTLHQIVTMASLVEREANDPAEMRAVAGILWNRVEINMALNVDATLQYLRGYDEAQQDWWSPPTIDYKESSSPFNTYKVPGLPPSPIANPSLEAIRATLEPSKTSEMYYIHDRQGKIHTAKTLEEHNRNVQQYLR